ncbi:hypothetical protein JOF53_001990 [Crossiella equi]|uniref:Band 7 domain-containing protein n=1 Tax=Crossiella equi TaxID=130796 RepID=A0ABS5A962_9PSEU|nr:hypothetical protein [Crossiella equi]MBP2473118.1 hypothetical protein [Crossiella equi]
MNGQKQEEHETSETAEAPEKEVVVEKEAAAAPKVEPGFTNPIVGERHFRAAELLFHRLPARARIFRVCLTRSGRFVEYPPDRQPTTGELLWNSVRTVYDIDMGSHVSQVEIELPSRGDEVTFRAVVDLVWRVVRPSEVVASGLTDVRRSLTPLLLQHLRAVTRRFEVHEAERAEAAANQTLTEANLGEGFGLSLQAFVRVAMDGASLERAAIQRKLEHFRSIIAAGDFDQAALQLTLKPEDISAVVQALVQERDSHRQAVFDFVTRLLESDALDRWQIDDQVRATLQWLRESGFKVLTGVDEARSVSFGEKPREPLIARSNGAGRP